MANISSFKTAAGVLCIAVLASILDGWTDGCR